MRTQRHLRSKRSKRAVSLLCAAHIARRAHTGAYCETCSAYCGAWWRILALTVGVGAFGIVGRCLGLGLRPVAGASARAEARARAAAWTCNQGLGFDQGQGLGLGLSLGMGLSVGLGQGLGLG